MVSNSLLTGDRSMVPCQETSVMRDSSCYAKRTFDTEEKPWRQEEAVIVRRGQDAMRPEAARRRMNSHTHFLDGSRLDSVGVLLPRAHGFIKAWNTSQC